MAEAYPDGNDESTSTKLPDKLLEEDDYEDSRLKLSLVKTLREHHEAVRTRLDKFSLAQIVGDFDPNSIFPSIEPFRCLTKVSLRDLSIDKHSEGNYVLIRILEPGIQVIGWLWVIEDDQGNGCMLNVYNYPPLELPCVGTVLIVKEPLLKVTTLKIPLIKCECPTDIIVIRRSHKLHYVAEAVNWRNRLGQMEDHEDIVLHHPLIIRAERWFEYGLSIFCRGNWALAVECYLLALKTLPRRTGDQWKTIQSNLCLAYLCLGYYEKTIATSELVGDDRLALLCAGRAYYYLRRFEDARVVFEKLFLRNESDEEISRELYNSVERLREQESGFWGLERLMYFGNLRPYKRLEYGDFGGPVELVKIPGKGRGLRLTRDVPPETILIVSKAIATTVNPLKIVDIHWPSKKWIPNYINVNDLELEAEIAQVIIKNPNTFGPMIYDLSVGEVPHNKVKLFCDSEDKDEPICDMVTIAAIRYCNSFYIFPIDEIQEYFGSGLFIFPSYLNHSCEPNVLITFYNDVMVVRSIGQLKSGAELCMSYVDGVDAIERQRAIRREGFCACLCEFCSKSP